MSLWIPYNPNPISLNTTDCTVRALCKALNNIDWDAAFGILSEAARQMCTMPSSKVVLWAVLRQHGFNRRFVKDECDCYTVEDFAIEHPVGIYVLCCDDHVVTVQGGQIWDAWDSSREVPIYYWYRKDGRK